MASTEAVAPLARQRGKGRRTIAFLHGSLSSGRMWKPYVDALPERESVTPDLVGYGASRPWPDGRPFRLSDEVARLHPVLDQSDSAFDIVAHSYGGAVAMHYACRNPVRVRSLLLFEPTCFRLLADADVGAPAECGEIRWVARTVSEGVELGAPEAAMRHFVDYWNGAGAWDGLPADRRARFIDQAATVARNFEAGFADDVSLDALRSLDIPTLIVSGARSTNASLTASWTLAALLPRAEAVTVKGAGHMMPLTHVDVSLRLVRTWLDEGRIARRLAA